MLHSLVLLTSACVLAADAPQSLSPIEARNKIGERITVEMQVETAKDRLEKRGEIYLDSELDFRDEKNFAVVITRDGAASLKDRGIHDPAGHFLNKRIRAQGVVTVVDDVPRIEVNDVKQIVVVEKQ